MQCLLLAASGLRAVFWQGGHCVQGSPCNAAGMVIKKVKQQPLYCVGTLIYKNFQQPCMTDNSLRRFKFMLCLFSCFNLVILLPVQFSFVIGTNKTPKHMSSATCCSAWEYVITPKQNYYNIKDWITKKLNKESELQKVWKSKHEAKNLEYGALFIIGLSRNKEDFFKGLNVHQSRLLIPLVFHSAFVMFKVRAELLIGAFTQRKL